MICITTGRHGCGSEPAPQILPLKRLHHRYTGTSPVLNGNLPLAILCNSMVMPEQKITLHDGGRTVRKQLSHELLFAMQDPKLHAQAGWKGARILA